MAQKLHNAARSASASVGTSGANYLALPNGKKIWSFTTAITANVTLDDAVAVGPVAGDLGVTTHATGLASMFVSDGTKWQFLTNA